MVVQGKVDAKIYSGIPSSERRRIAKELKKVRERRIKVEAEAWRIYEANPDPEWKPWLKNNESSALGLVRSLLIAVEVPLSLLACGFCHKPATQCICKNEDGTPLNWK